MTMLYAKQELIDNALCKLSHNFLNTTSGIIVTKLSDHLPYFVCIPQKTTNILPNPKYVYVRQNNYQLVNQFKTAIENASIYDKLNTHIDADPSINYDIVNYIISNIHKDCMSHKKVKFNKHKHAKSDWITQGIIKSIQFRDNLYVKLKQTQTNTLAYITEKTNLKTYNKILKRNIEHPKRIYYEHRFNKYKNVAKNTWKVIKELINRNVAKIQKPCRFKVDDKILNEEHEIANAFNTYFTNIGASLASNIKTNKDKTFDYFLGRPRALKFTFNQITETDVIKIIDGGGHRKIAVTYPQTY